MITYFPSVADIKLVYLLTREYTYRHFPLIPYKRLLTTEVEIDDVHGEIPESNKRWAEDIIQLRAFVVPSQMVQPLTAFGMEEQRDCELVVATPDLVTAGLATQDPKTFEVEVTARIGDHFTYHDAEYEILVFLPVARWGNTDLILYYQFQGKYYRPEITNLL